MVKYLRGLGIQGYSLRKKEIKGYADESRPNQFLSLRPKWRTIRRGKSLPLVVQFHFVRDSKRKFDFQNAVQIIADLLVAHDFIEDDDMDNFIPVPFKKDGKWYSVDKGRPGVYLKIN